MSKEIQSVIKNLSPNKNPRQNGFTDKLLMNIDTKILNKTLPNSKARYKCHTPTVSRIYPWDARKI